MEDAILGIEVTHNVRMHRLQWFSPKLNIDEAADEARPYLDKLKHVSECRRRGTLDKEYWLDNALVPIVTEIVDKVIILVVMMDASKEESQPKETKVEFYIQLPHPQDKL